MGYRTARGTYQEAKEPMEHFDERLSNGQITLTVKYDVLDQSVQVEQLFDENQTSMDMTTTQWTEFRSRCVDNGYTLVG
jgi:hypothetical protein